MKHSNRMINTFSKVVKYSAAALTMVLAIAALGVPSAAGAQIAGDNAVKAGKCGTQPVTPEGSWLYTVKIPGYQFQGVETYGAGGTYTEADQLSFAPFGVATAGHGAWKSTGDRTFLLTYVNLTFDGFSSGNPTGTLVVRQTTTESYCGNFYTGSGDYTYYDLDGNPIPSISGTFTITSTKIVVEAPK